MLKNKNLFAGLKTNQDDKRIGFRF